MVEIVTVTDEYGIEKVFPFTFGTPRCHMLAYIETQLLAVHHGPYDHFDSDEASDYLTLYFTDVDGATYTTWRIDYRTLEVIKL